MTSRSTDSRGPSQGVWVDLSQRNNKNKKNKKDCGVCLDKPSKSDTPLWCKMPSFVSPIMAPNLLEVKRNQR